MSGDAASNRRPIRYPDLHEGMTQAGWIYERKSGKDYYTAKHVKVIGEQYGIRVFAAIGTLPDGSQRPNGMSQMIEVKLGIYGWREALAWAEFLYKPVFNIFAPTPE